MGESEAGAGITRRQALKRGAVVAGTAAWVAPLVQTLAMSPASAAQPSGAGVRRGRGGGKGTGIVRSGGRANPRAGG